MQELITVLIMFLPVLIVLWLANLAERARERGQPQVLTILTYLLLIILWGVLILSGVVIMLSGLFLRGQGLPPALLDTYQQMGINPETVTSIIGTLPQMGLALWLPSVFGIILLLRPVRKWISRFIPIDPASPVHAVALSFTMLVVVNLWVTVAIGIGNLADMMATGPEMETSNILNLLWLQEIVMALMAFIGVGWLSARRGLRQALQRLQIVVPSLRQVLLGIGIGLGMALALIPIEYLLNRIGIGVDPDVTRLTDQIIGPLATSVFGVLTLGLAAALGEESIFRGALQPRFGLVLQAVLFALLHSTYGLSLATVIVLVIGLILGWVRARHNTSTSMIVHAVYNMTIGFIALYGLLPE